MIPCVILQVKLKAYKILEDDFKNCDKLAAIIYVEGNILLDMGRGYS